MSVLLENYKENNLLINLNFLEKTSDAAVMGYRGELVLIEGGVGDAKGHARPPLAVMRGAVLLAGEKLKLVVGAVDKIAEVQTFLDKYLGDLEADAKLMIFVVDISKPFQIAAEGLSIACIPMQLGMPWNEAIEELRLEKSDFKGQSPADKIVTLYKEMKSYKPSGDTLSLTEAMARSEDIKREAFGPV